MVQIIDPAKRTEQLRRLQKIIADDAVNGYLYQLAKVGIWKKELVGMWENSPTPAIDMTQVSWK
jgi:peptide/nickel transport system substrate-binding protein